MWRRNDIKKIVNYYGIDKQIDIWLEEMAELTKALLKMKRYFYKEHLVQDVKEEMIDVSICLDEIRYSLGIQKKWENKYRNFKLNRQLKRIKIEEEKGNEITNS